MKVEIDYLWKKYTFIPTSKENEMFIEVFNKYVDDLEEENKNLKKELHNTQLLLKAWMDDYMELEEENKKLKDDYRDMVSRACDYKWEIADLKRGKGLGLDMFLKFKWVLDDNKYLPKKAEHWDVYFIAGINKNYFYTMLWQWKDLEDYKPGD